MTSFKSLFITTASSACLFLTYIQHVDSFSHITTTRTISTTRTTSKPFSVPGPGSQMPMSMSIQMTMLQSKKDDNDNDETMVQEEEDSGFLSLPPIGESSFNPFTSSDIFDKDHQDQVQAKANASSNFSVNSSSNSNSNNKSSTNSDDNININTNTNTNTNEPKQVILNDEKGTKVGLVGSKKFELQYTCNVCETRNTHKVSRLAYTKGVVITVCKGCLSKHLIADNLGWSKHWGSAGFMGNNNIEEYMDDIGKGDEVNRVSKDVFQLEQILDDTPGSDIMSDGSSIAPSDDENAFE